MNLACTRRLPELPGAAVHRCFSISGGSIIQPQRKLTQSYLFLYVNAKRARVPLRCLETWTGKAVESHYEKERWPCPFLSQCFKHYCTDTLLCGPPLRLLVRMMWVSCFYVALARASMARAAEERLTSDGFFCPDTRTLLLLHMYVSKKPLWFLLFHLCQTVLIAMVM